MLILYRVDKNNKNIIIIIVDEILVEKRTPVRYNTRVEISTRIRISYGRLDFLIGNNSIRKKAYQNLYNKVYVFKRACLEHCLAFRPYVAGHGNEVVRMDKMLSLQSQVFENRDGAYYAKLRDELRHDLETFRSQTYNDNPEYEDPYPVHYFINFEDTESVERYKRHIEKAKQEGRDEQTKITSV